MKYGEFFGKRISKLGFGAMRMPFAGGDRSVINVEAATALVDCCMQVGVNYFDTAYNYHGGASEVFLGEALKKYDRESYFVADKMPSWLAGSKKEARRIFQSQLEKCGLDYFDFYLMHNYYTGYFDACEEAGIYSYLAEMRDAGRIGRLGLSIHDDVDGLEKILKAHPWDFVQLQINYIDWEMLKMDEQFAVARGLGIPVIIMEPLRGGSLIKLPAEAQKVLKQADPDMGPAEWALRFVDELPGVMTILSGMDSVRQVKENSRIITGGKELDDKKRAALKKASEIYRASGEVPCTSCEYCMPCPFGVAIPTLFTLYNEYRRTKEDWAFLNAAAMLGEDGLAGNCTTCGQCAKRCPQQIDIPALMEKVAVLERG